MAKIYNTSPGHPAKIDIKAKKNDTFKYQVIGYNKDGSSYDFTGHTFILQVKNQGDIDTDVAIIDITNDDFTITQNAKGLEDGVNNVVDIEHPDTSMNKAANCYQYDLQMTDGAGKIQTIQEGDFILTQDTSE